MGDVTELPARVAPAQRGRPKTRVAKALQRQKVINMLLAGATEQQIADTLDMRPSSVSKIVLAVLDAWETAEQANVEKVRTLQLARIDRMVRALWNDAVGVRSDGTATQPSLRAIAEIRNLEALRARIAGTEAAKKVEVSGSLGFHLDSDELERAEQAWLGSAGDVVEGVARELASGE